MLNGRQETYLCVQLSLDVLLILKIPVSVEMLLKRVGFVLAEPCGDYPASYDRDAAYRGAVKIAHLRHVTSILEKFFIFGGERELGFD